MFNFRRFLLFLVMFLFTVSLQARMHEIFGWSIEFVLTLLIVSAFWNSLPEHLVLIILGIWFMNWRPGLAPELLAFAVVPVLAFFTGRFFSWRRGVTIILFVAVAVISMYILSLGRMVLADRSILLGDVVGSVFFGIALHGVIRMTYEQRANNISKGIYALPR